MKIEYLHESSQRELVDTSSGEVFNQQVSFSKKHTYYNVKKINTKVTWMDIMDTMELVCKSSQDIYIFGRVLDKTDPHGEIRVNVSEYSKQIGIHRSQVTAVMKRMVDKNMMKRVERGVYLVNPFQYKAKGCSNQTMEKLQQDWN